MSHTKISFNDNVQVIPSQEPVNIDDILENDDFEDDEDFEEDEDDEIDEDDEEYVDENDSDDDDNNKQIYYDNDGTFETIEVDEENNVLRIVCNTARDRPEIREFQEQELMQSPFTKVGGLTLPALEPNDLLTFFEPQNACSICLQRECNIVMLPCNDANLCLTCVHENFSVRQQSGIQIICPTCCRPVSNILRTKRIKTTN